MSITATYCEKVIRNGTYGTADEMKEKLDVFLLNNRITQDEYNQLITFLKPTTSDALTSSGIDASSTEETTTTNTAL